MFPGDGKFTGCETGVDKKKKDVTDGIETEPENLDADTVRTGGSVARSRVSVARSQWGNQKGDFWCF